MDIPVVVSGFRDLEESLRSITSSETLQGQNQYFCDGCNARVDAERKTEIKALPPILTLSLLRFGFDFQQGKRIKIKSHFAFPTTLDLSPYVAEEIRGDCIYDVYSVVVHSGDAYGGHYRAYIHASSPGSSEPAWYDFDDSRVKKVEETVLESQFSGAESACKRSSIFPPKECCWFSQSDVYFSSLPSSKICLSIVSGGLWRLTPMSFPFS